MFSQSFSMYSMFNFVIYLVSSFSFYKLAKIRCIDNAWMAFIPFFNLYIIGYIGDTLKYNNQLVNQYFSTLPLSYALPIGSMIGSFAGVIPLIGGMVGALISLAVYLGQLLVYFLVFDSYTTHNRRLLFTLLSIVPVLGPLLILYCLKEYHSY